MKWCGISIIKPFAASAVSVYWATKTLPFSDNYIHFNRISDSISC